MLPEPQPNGQPLPGSRQDNLLLWSAMAMTMSLFLVGSHFFLTRLESTEIKIFIVVDQPSTKITMKFLNDGLLPAAQESELFSVYTPGMTRKPISDPYEVPTGAIAGDVDSGIVTVEIPF
jgi:hypothetical protein